MGYTLTVEGTEKVFYGREVISNVQVNLHSPSDTKAKTANPWISLVISGKLHFGGDGMSSATIKLNEWAHIAAENETAYCKVSVAIDGPRGENFRTIILDKAFVEDYQERYRATRGAGDFTIVIRQKADLLRNVRVE